MMSVPKEETGFACLTPRNKRDIMMAVPGRVLLWLFLSAIAHAEKTAAKTSRLN